MATQGVVTGPIQTPQILRTWKAGEILRLGQLPLDTDDPAPAQVEACICRLLEKVRDSPGDEEIAVSEEEDAVLKDIQRCERGG